MKKISRIIFLPGLLLILLACQPTRKDTDTRISDSLSPAVPSVDSAKVLPADSLADSVKTSKTDSARIVSAPTPKVPQAIQLLPDSGFVELIQLDSTLVLDLRYATPDNFLKEKVYDCARCLLRKEAALALVKAHQVLKQKGYRLRLFDCYRPLDVQKKMWKIMPDDRFVGNPYGNGSMHNKGAAVDLTLADSTGKELEMGTPFDFFGREAYHAYTNLPPDVLNRRRLLKQTLMQAGFSPITSEWWHYSYNRKSYRVANFKPACE